MAEAEGLLFTMGMKTTFIWVNFFLLTKAKRTKHLNNIARNEAKFCCDITQWEQVDPEDSYECSANISTISLVSAIKALQTQ